MPALFHKELQAAVLRHLPFPRRADDSERGAQIRTRSLPCAGASPRDRTRFLRQPLVLIEYFAVQAVVAGTGCGRAGLRPHPVPATTARTDRVLRSTPQPSK